MDLSSVGIYFVTNGAAAFSGLLYWWTVENMQPFGTEPRKLHRLPLIIVLILLFSPIGALFISMVVKSRRILRDIKQTEEEK